MAWWVKNGWLIFRVVVVTVGGALFVLALSTSQAPSASADLAPRPQPAPSESPPGYIELRIHWTFQQRWTVVQWLDGTGQWHDVEGWRGGLDETAGAVGRKTWAVIPRDFGTGPFRWVVYDGPGGRALVASEKFYLANSGETVMRDLLLPW